MTANLKDDGTIELEVRREFPFPREMVFGAWVNEDHLGKWMGPTDEITMEGIKVDAREGGGYRSTLMMIVTRCMAFIKPYKGPVNWFSRGFGKLMETRRKLRLW